MFSYRSIDTNHTSGNTQDTHRFPHAGEWLACLLAISQECIPRAYSAESILQQRHTSNRRRGRGGGGGKGGGMLDLSQDGSFSFALLTLNDLDANYCLEFDARQPRGKLT